MSALDYNDDWDATLRDHDDSVEELNYWLTRDAADDALADDDRCECNGCGAVTDDWLWANVDYTDRFTAIGVRLHVGQVSVQLCALCRERLGE